ncbi:Retrovirus-related Pol polyprotein from transposon TNT 1-94 [Cucumis melo var. makuwa]|uniref:Retrovirus-related Pol polyprotein from transposon TNT 1-94 n=1 Tax=Cucumis melo var. makuwa TaxID=1194695 RepID=A0A5A7T3U0_CUCMM|nr:Retrovirus-related Pol polyprotein from transposon TNT 1-94 [Cucumis melo var. makuwa]TYJ95844.1 Retrovirus-related Pol polyprotein from transposon TNT 1-94 [Cucumis melo var. makuwa]
MDADFAGDPDKRKSLTGFAFTLGENLISWKSNLQSVVALSTTEAEFIVVSEVVKEAMWLRGIVSKLGYKQEAVELMCDNQSAIHLTKNKHYHDRTKHIDVKLHFVQDIIEK